MIFQFLLVRLRNQADAEEAFQETFLRIHRFITSYDESQTALAWVFTIARNVAIDSFKNRKATVDIDTVTLVSQAKADVVLIAREELKAMLDKLSHDEKILLQRRLLDDSAFEEISSETGISNISLRKRFSRLIRKLRT